DKVKLYALSGPVLQSLMDNLLKEKVLSDSEREAVEAEKVRGDKGRVLIDTVRRKGAAASSEMIRFLCELDPRTSDGFYQPEGSAADFTSLERIKTLIFTLAFIRNRENDQQLTVTSYEHKWV
uniref:CARD domain-containing protein n=1 Tax=Poecilia latipinna TaxID=48699 RepID=A0A3B3UUC1_9TELE